MTTARDSSGSRRSPEDTLAIQDVVDRYAFALDNRDWEALRHVFTEDAEVEEAAPGAPGLDNVIKQLRGNEHPYQHVIANHVIEDVSEDEVIVWSKALFPLPRERVVEAMYRDVVVRTPDGWRIKHKSAKRYSPEALPSRLGSPNLWAKVLSGLRRLAEPVSTRMRASSNRRAAQ